MHKHQTGNIPEINIKKKLKAIAEKGFIKNLRKGDTGIGFTLETELGINENNFISHDLTFKDDLVELKAQRLHASSNITLITKSPYWNPLSAKTIIEKYGYPDKRGRHVLKFTHKITEFNSQLFKKELKDNHLNIIHKTDGILCYFVLNELMEKVKTKLSKHLLFVIADTKKQHGVEYFHFNEATYLTDLSEDGFKKLLDEGMIVFEFRMHLKESGGVRDHGSGFRLNKRHITKLYSKNIKIL